jgi:hypothetical protein
MPPETADTPYAAIIRDHLTAAFEGNAGLLAAYPGVDARDDGWRLTAFGQSCTLSPQGIVIDGRTDWGPRGIIIALLAKHAAPDPRIDTPWQAFRDLPDSAPYVGAFRARTELLLVPRVSEMYHQRTFIATRFKARPAPEEAPGDWTLVLDPLPKISLCYHFYLPDEEFPANATCLFSNNAHRFLPTDALADVGEYTSRALIASVS